MAIGAFICGCRGLEFTPDEIAFVRESDPWGFILFKRNIDSADQVRALTGHFRKLVGRDDAPVLVDQEGGRVQRLGPPHWPGYPPARRFGEIFAQDPLSGLAAARWTARLIADDLRQTAAHDGVIVNDQHPRLPGTGPLGHVVSLGPECRSTAYPRRGRT